MRLVVFLALATLSWGASVSGTVYLRQDRERRPLAGVRVAARAADGGEPFATATTDAQGRYRLPNLAPRRLLVRASKPGYFAQAVAAREESLVLDPAAGEDLFGADFELQRGGVITGRLTDAWGEPLDKLTVALSRLADPDGRHRDYFSDVPSDDRGVYRAYGLPPGRYTLRVLRPRREGIEDHPAPLYYPGATDPSRAGHLEVAAGQEIRGIDLVVRPEPLFQLSGRIVEAPREEPAGAHLQVQWAVGELYTVASVNPDGRFVLPRLPAGSYIVSAFAGNRPHGRLVVTLDENRSDVVLRPTPPGQLSGRILLAGRAQPPEILLEAEDRIHREFSLLRARAPEYRFTRANMWPGNYSFQVRSPKGAYLIGTGGAVVPEGGTVEIELRIGLETSRISGMAKAPAGGALAHGRVALARVGSEPLVLRTEQTDQRGRFEIRDLRPGEYQICAWPVQNVAALDDPRTWTQAGPAVKRFSVEPGAQIEIELTAAP